MIALDIALYPDSTSQTTIRALQKQLNPPNQPFNFDDGYFPHISLAMFFAKLDDVPAIKDALHETNIILQAVSVSNGTLPADEPVSGLEVVVTPELLAYRRTVLEIAERYAQKVPPTTQMYFDPPNQFTTEYSSNYLDLKRDPTNFHPHITLGLGHLTSPQAVLPFTFTAQARLFHLGNYCTCRSLL